MVKNPALQLAELTRDEILALGKQNGWLVHEWQENIRMLSLFKGNVRINIYVTKMTVATCLNHPKKGKTQMFRKNVSLELLDKIFKNPRVHTKKGYRKK